MEINVNIVGDQSVGKSCILHSFIYKRLPWKYEETSCDLFSITVKENNIDYSLKIWDTSGNDDMYNLRKLSYMNCDVFVICYEVSSRSSFNNVSDKWMKEIKQFYENPIVILVATKCDLRREKSNYAGGLIEYEEGIEKSKEIKAKKYVEVSSLSHQTLAHLIYEIINQHKIKYNKNKCLIL
jgi:small GTP-binding protein